MLVISVYVSILIISGKIEYVNIVQIEFLFIILIIIRGHVSINLFLIIIMLSGVRRVIFILLYIKSF